ncbi:MAG TPA: serine hydrolase domain-containing protein [Pseudosphingobacterium sp.]|nr:serine hydrolase domain-containing protein [Pseudosphingobacterium sp.]
MDRLLSAYLCKNPGASLLIVKDGKVLLQRTYGYADLKSKEPVTAATNFRLASVSKPFTATSIPQLIDKRKLTLGTTLTRAFPEFPAYGSELSY